MAKDNRRIVSGVQMRQADGTIKTYGTGEEDELQAVLSPGQLASLQAAGALEGDWKAEGEAPEIEAGSKVDVHPERYTQLGKTPKEVAKALDAAAADKAKKKMAADKAKKEEEAKEAPKPGPAHSHR